MNKLEAGRILERLSGHWPSIFGNDAAADDWLDMIRRMEPRRGVATCDALVNGWQKDRPPHIADWQETARQVALFVDREDRPAIEAPTEPLADSESVRAAIEFARKSIDANRYRRSA